MWTESDWLVTYIWQGCDGDGKRSLSCNVLRRLSHKRRNDRDIGHRSRGIPPCNKVTNELVGRQNNIYIIERQYWYYINNGRKASNFLFNSRYLYTEDLFTALNKEEIAVAFEVLKCAGKYGVPYLYIECRQWIVQHFVEKFEDKEEVKTDALLYLQMVNEKLSNGWMLGFYLAAYFGHWKSSTRIRKYRKHCGVRLMSAPKGFYKLRMKYYVMSVLMY